jgi:hypothetical protein
MTDEIKVIITILRALCESLVKSGALSPEDMAQRLSKMADKSEHSVAEAIRMFSDEFIGYR